MTHRFSRHVRIAGAALAAMIAPPALADAEITAEMLTDRHAFTDDVTVEITLVPEGLEPRHVEIDDPSHIAMGEMTVPPGAALPWHTHPGSSLAAVTSGELVHVHREDCVERPIAAGAAFVDPGFDNVHSAYNPSDSDPATVIATFIGVPEDEPLTIPVDAEESAELDAACGIER